MSLFDSNEWLPFYGIDGLSLKYFFKIKKLGSSYYKVKTLSFKNKHFFGSPILTIKMLKWILNKNVQIIYYSIVISFQKIQYK